MPPSRRRWEGPTRAASSRSPRTQPKISVHSDQTQTSLFSLLQSFRAPKKGEISTEAHGGRGGRPGLLCQKSQKRHVAYIYFTHLSPRLYTQAPGSPLSPHLRGTCVSVFHAPMSSSSSAPLGAMVRIGSARAVARLPSRRARYSRALRRASSSTGMANGPLFGGTSEEAA